MTWSHFSMSNLTAAVRTRRGCLADMGLGFAGLALGAMLHRDGYAGSRQWSPPTGQPHSSPKAKSVIWLFMTGGVSHLESFDPKPALNKYGGLHLSKTPLKDVYDSPFVKENAGKLAERLFDIDSEADLIAALKAGTFHAGKGYPRGT